MAKKNVGFGKLLFHVLLTLFTGGLWLMVLVIWYILHNGRRNG